MIKRKLTPHSLFMGGLITLNALMILQLPIHEGLSFFSLLHSDPNDTFMDLFNSIRDATVDNPYTDLGVIYPPLTYLYYRLLKIFLPIRDPFTWKSSQSGIILAIVVTSLTLVSLYKILLSSKKSDCPQNRRMILWLLLGTVPFWYAIERGNLVLQTLVFLAYFVQNYQSESPLKRELALISLSIAAAFKIYPACFGVLLIKNKQYKETLRCLVYGTLIFFLPFCFFGGLQTFQVMIQNILKTNGYMAAKGWGYKVNIDNTLSFLQEMLHMSLPYTEIFKGIIVAALLFTLFFSKKNWQCYMALCAAMLLFPGFSYTYTLIFVALPLWAFFNDFPKDTPRNFLFSLLFLCIFAPIPYGGAKMINNSPDYIYQLNTTTVVSSLSLLGMTLFIPIDIIINSMHKHKEPKHISLE